MVTGAIPNHKHDGPETAPAHFRAQLSHQFEVAPQVRPRRDREDCTLGVRGAGYSKSHRGWCSHSVRGIAFAKPAGSWFGLEKFTKFCKRISKSKGPGGDSRELAAVRLGGCQQQPTWLHLPRPSRVCESSVPKRALNLFKFSRPRLGSPSPRAALSVSRWRKPASSADRRRRVRGLAAAIASLPTPERARHRLIADRPVREEGLSRRAGSRARPQT
jgi:hypothetical protein